MANQQLQSQLRAEFAYKKINAVVDESARHNKDFQKNLRSYIQSLPAMIQMNGFGQAVAFVVSQSKSDERGKAYKTLYTWISEWLKLQHIYTGDLMQSIGSESMQTYQFATAETLELLVWLKKFARAYLQGE